MKKYYIYLTTNLINNKKYVGQHYGEINDNYIGSGNTLKKLQPNMEKKILKKRFCRYVKIIKL